MGLLGGIMKSVINPISIAQLAMGPAGWAALAMRTIGAQIGMNVLQNLGQQLGLPQNFIDTVKSGFATQIGLPGLATQSMGQAVGGLTGFSPTAQGELARAGDSAVKSLVDQAMRSAGDDARKLEKEAEAEGTSTVEAKGGFLRMIAAALGGAADSKMNEMINLANQIKDQTSSNSAFTDGLGSKPSNGDMLKANNNSSKLGTMNSMFQAVSQELSILQNVISSALKTVGEAQSTVARKG